MLRGIIAGIAIAMSIVGCAQQRTGIAAVADAMGATNLNSIEYSGSGELFGFGQAYIPGERWPRFIQRSYNVAVSYQTPAMRMNTVRSQGEFPPRGSAAQPVGADQRTIQVVSGKYASTEGGPKPKPNVAVTLNVPENVAQAPAPPAKPAVNVQKLADGVLYLTAAGISSWAVEFKDYVVAVEGPNGEARSLAVNEEIQKRIPNKPIKYVVNTHAHYDHAGGLRTYVAQGITVITHERNKPFFETVWASPRTVAPDMLSQNPKPAVFETVQEKKVITDGTRTLELYHLQNSGHNVATLIAYLPKEALLYYGDGYNPPPGDNPIDPARTPEYGIDLYRNVTLLNLNIKTIAPAHSTRPVPFDNLKKAIGLLPVELN